MLGATPAAHEELPDLNMCRLTAGGRVGLVLDEHPPRRGLSDERPSITIWRAAIKLSPLERHRILPVGDRHPLEIGVRAPPSTEIECIKHPPRKHPPPTGSSGGLAG